VVTPEIYNPYIKGHQAVSIPGNKSVIFIGTIVQ
jgi:hypothetical protein